MHRRRSEKRVGDTSPTFPLLVEEALEIACRLRWIDYACVVEHDPGACGKRGPVTLRIAVLSSLVRRVGGTIWRRDVAALENRRANWIATPEDVCLRPFLFGNQTIQKSS